MNQNIQRFYLNSHIIKDGYHESLDFCNDGRILLKNNKTYGFFITKKLDSSKTATNWGRVVIDANFSQDCEYNIYIMASDELDFRYENKIITYDDFFNSKEIQTKEKILVLSSSGQSKVQKNSKDILLLGLEGRYLWLALEIKYATLNYNFEQQESLNNILVYFPGDSLIKYLPEIYKKNKDNFFERYLAIFSSMNKDYQRKVDSVCDLIDIDKTSDSALILLSQWLGLDINGNFLNNNQLRILIKNARYLNQYKGTIDVIIKVVELFIGDKPIIIEQIKIREYINSNNFNLYQELYGSDPHEFLIILNKNLNQEMFYQLKILINMFKPARTQPIIIFLEQKCKLDSHCYLDINSRLSSNIDCVLDQDRYLDTNVILSK
ncbi:MAG: hypothetical protein J6C55_01555 [Oscillospiraceae bacterium]|nr:hypothetical protein [Oscillospiraceae bacterium]